MPDHTPYSSPCGIAETDPSYNGFLTAKEVTELLYNLLHAERAGVYVCHVSRRDVHTGRHRQLLRHIQQDEIKSCRALIKSLQWLGAKPDSIVGDFAEKCLAIRDMDERLRYLNRGQRWVAKKVAEALPRIQEEAIQRQLVEMLKDHRRNIERVTVFLDEQRADGVENLKSP